MRMRTASEFIAAVRNEDASEPSRRLPGQCPLRLPVGPQRRHRLAERTDDSFGDARPQAEGIANRDREVADLQLRRVGERSRLQVHTRRRDQSEVVGRKRAGERGAVALAVRVRQSVDGDGVESVASETPATTAAAIAARTVRADVAAAAALRLADGRLANGQRVPE